MARLLIPGAMDRHGIAHPLAECRGGQLHPNAKDMRGLKFGRLQVVAFAGHGRGRSLTWECICDCGSTVVVVGTDLRLGDTQSCGCRQREISRAAGDRTRTHGMSSTPIYKLWSSMLQRCYDETHADFPNYGGRGIQVCVRWWLFKNFFSDMGHRPVGRTLNRISNDGEYGPENCEWATLVEQARNNRNNRVLSVLGIRLCLIEWAERQRIRAETISARLKRGWSEEAAVLTPIDKRCLHDKQ